MFVVYDKDVNEHKITHQIDYKTAIRGGVLTAEKPVKKVVVKKDPVVKPEKPETKKSVKKFGFKK